MDKRINWLAIIPMYGTAILWLWLFVKMRKKELNWKPVLYFYLIGLLTLFSFVLVVFVLAYLVNVLDFLPDFVNTYGTLILTIIVGYLLNLWAFTIVNAKWVDMHDFNKR